MKSAISTKFNDESTVLMVGQLISQYAVVLCAVMSQPRGEAFCLPVPSQFCSKAVFETILSRLKACVEKYYF